MDIDVITTLVGNVGFPIAVCVALFYKMNRDDDKHREDTDKLRGTIDKNTDVLSELTTLIRTIVKQ